MDELARDYLLLALGVGRLEDGIVDAYYGPPELRTEADERDASAEQLATDAAALRLRVAADPDPGRARWLDRQLNALETLARRLGGEDISYVEEVTRCVDAAPERTPEDAYLAVHDRLDALLPPGDSLRERMEERGRRLTVPAGALPAVVAWLVDELRRASAAVFPAPAGEALTVSLVTGQPWSAYNWYDGGLKSRIEVNTDLPARASELISLMTHEAFPGHHLEHAWKETRLVREQGRAEATIQLINTPEAYISEGLAEVGGSLALEPLDWQRLFAGICERAGIELEPGQPEREWETTDALRALRSTSADAALMLHADGCSRDDVLDFLQRWGLRSREQAEKGLQFIDHPLWRTYVFCYSGGEKLLGRWCRAADGPEAQRAKFFRLLTEQVTPSEIAAETAPG